MPDLKIQEDVLRAVVSDSPGQSVAERVGAISPTVKTAMVAASTIGGATGAYHGYKRHRGSLGWAIGWSLLGSLAPFITVPVSLAQGFGKPERKAS